jgi:hypothetical protein
MPLPQQIVDREYQKFEHIAPGETAVRVTSTGIPVTPSGLTIGGFITVVALNDSSWVALPPVPLTNRNQINIQNETSFDFKIRYDNTFVGYAGVTIASGSERQYAIKDTIIIYAKMSPGGSGSITVEELA